MTAALQRLADLRPRVVCLGLTAYDETWEVEQLPQGGGKLRALAYREGGGGMAANAAVAVARLGGRAAFWGRAGDDRAGRAMRDELRALGVDADGLRLFAGARSSVSGIVVDAQGERSIVNFRGADLPDDAAWLPLNTLGRVQAVLADPRWPAGASALFAAARAAGIPTVIDGDVAPREVFDRLLPWVDHAIFSRAGLADATGTRDLDKGLERALRPGMRLAAVTLGEEGLRCSDGATVWHLPAHAVRAVDTTGAGDVFHGAYALAIAGGCSVADALRLASATAALKCRQRGGRDGIPELRSVLEFLALNPEP